MNSRTRYAVVTGAGGQIGAATAAKLAQSCAGVALFDMTDCAATAQQVEAAGAQAILVQGDVTRRGDVASCMDTAASTFGRIDILANVAGIGNFCAFTDISEEDWTRTIDVDLKGTFLCCQAAVAKMLEQRYGRIVNVGSLVAKNGGNTSPWLDAAELSRTASTAYACAKAGVHALTVSLAKQVADRGITVNAVAPGPILSPMTATLYQTGKQRQIPVQRAGTAEEVAFAIDFLASEQAGFITGEILDVNGGLWMD